MSGIIENISSKNPHNKYERITVLAHDMLYEIGDEATHIYLVQSGSLQIMHTGSIDVMMESYSTRTVGCICGIPEALCDMLHITQVVALEDSVLIKLKPEQFKHLLFMSVNVKRYTFLLLGDIVNKLYTAVSINYLWQNDTYHEPYYSHAMRIFLRKQMMMACRILGDYINKQKIKINIPVFNDVYEKLQKVPCVQWDDSLDTQTLQLNSGAVLFVEGVEAEHLFFLERGSVQCYKCVNQQLIQVNIIERKNYFLNLRENMQAGICNSYTIIVRKPSVIQRIKQQSMMQVLGTSPFGVQCWVMQLSFEYLQHYFILIGLEQQSKLDRTFFYTFYQLHKEQYFRNNLYNLSLYISSQIIFDIIESNNAEGSQIFRGLFQDRIMAERSAMINISDYNSFRNLYRNSLLNFVQEQQAHSDNSEQERRKVFIEEKNNLIVLINFLSFEDLHLIIDLAKEIEKVENSAELPHNETKISRVYPLTCFNLFFSEQAEGKQQNMNFIIMNTRRFNIKLIILRKFCHIFHKFGKFCIDNQMPKDVTTLLYLVNKFIVENEDGPETNIEKRVAMLGYWM